MDSTALEKIQLYLVLFVTLSVTLLLFLYANASDQIEYPIFDEWYVTDILFIIIPIAVLFLSIKLVLKYRDDNKIRKTWYLFVLFISCWFVAEQLFDYESEYDINKIESYIADIFWLTGYAFLFMFSIFYVRGMKIQIPKKIIVYACLIAPLLLTPIFNFDYSNSEIGHFELILNLLYPIADAIVIIPAIIGMMINFKKGIDFMWMIIFFAIIISIIGDTIYLTAISQDTYDVGHPADIMFIWAYILFGYGLYYHLNSSPASKMSKITAS